MPETQTLNLPVDDNYSPSDGELNNFVYLCCKYTVGWGMRQADLAICLMLAGGKEAIKGNEGLSKLCDVTCEYLWDHICGEPEEPTAEKLFEHIKPILGEWYNKTTPEQRTNTA